MAQRRSHALLLITLALLALHATSFATATPGCGWRFGCIPFSKKSMVKTTETTTLLPSSSARLTLRNSKAPSPSPQRPKAPPPSPMTPRMPIKPPSSPMTPRIPETPSPNPMTPEMPQTQPPSPMTPGIPQTPSPNPLTPEMPKTPPPSPMTPEMPQTPPPSPMTPRIPETPSPNPMTPEMPQTPPTSPMTPRIPETPSPNPMTPEMPQTPPTSPKTPMMPQTPPTSPKTPRMPETPREPTSPTPSSSKQSGSTRISDAAQYRSLLHLLQLPYSDDLREQMITFLADRLDELLKMASIPDKFSMDTPEGKDIAQTMLKSYQAQRVIFKDEGVNPKLKEYLATYFQFTLHKDTFVLHWKTRPEDQPGNQQVIALQHDMINPGISERFNILNAIDAVLENLLKNGSDGGNRLTIMFDTLTTAYNVVYIVYAMYPEVMVYGFGDLVMIQLAGRVLACILQGKEGNEGLLRDVNLLSTAVSATMDWMLVKEHGSPQQN